MQGITRCPNCQTAFKVVHEQLELADGRVRCGRCKHVFIAAKHWLMAEFDENEALFSQLHFRPVTTQYQSKAPYYIIGIAALLGILMQYSYAYPGRIIAKLPWLDTPLSIIRTSIAGEDRRNIDYQDLHIEHVIGRLNAQRQIRIDGIINSNSPTNQPLPDLLLSITTQDHGIAHKIIPATHIQWGSTSLAAQQKVGFNFWIKSDQMQVIDYKVSFCCQSKN